MIMIAEKVFFFFKGTKPESISFLQIKYLPLLSAHKPPYDFLWGGQDFQREGIKHEQSQERISSMLVSWQASPETSASPDGSQNLIYETELLRTQLNDSLKEIHQKELRIQQLNSKVSVSCQTGIQFLFSMTGTGRQIEADSAQSPSCSISQGTQVSPFSGPGCLFQSPGHRAISCSLPLVSPWE